ncbi:MAG: 3-keto-5-aminohexanoate cleavage protein [Deltaproteobacteria bacterium]|nr:3-keto-5-aminohexanoate cleavage protein [Deltaproteobacteria bacterium]
MGKLFVTAALTGAFTRKGDGKGASPYLPITPDEIAEEARRCVDAGASIIHIHARDPKTTGPSADLKIFQEISDKVRAACKGLICFTTGGGLDQTLAQRLAVVPACKPEIASYTGGVILYGMYNKQDRKWPLDIVPPLTYHDMEEFARVMEENNVVPELEIYDLGNFENIHKILQTGYLKPPLHFQIVMGMPGQVTPSNPHNLMHMVDTMKREFPADSTWSSCVAGAAQWPMCTMAAVLGADGVRTGMEDNLYVEKGRLAKSSAELVEKLVTLCRGVGREIASVEETRRIWGINTPS